MRCDQGLREGDMAELGDAAIKLFGRSIPLPDKDIGGKGEKSQVKVPVPLAADGVGLIEVDNLVYLNNDINDGDRQGSNQEGKEIALSRSERNPTETSEPCQEKTLKKPAKFLPCPRCNSTETKFCYYNNYNVNQPRHFCKNCHRYWTAGGTMRNLPLGAGRRKNKPSASNDHQNVLSPNEISHSQGDTTNSACPEALGSDPSHLTGTINSEESVLKAGHQEPPWEQKRSVELGLQASGETREETSCSSSLAVSSCIEGKASKQNGTKNSNIEGTSLNHMQYYEKVYPWNLGWNNINSMVTSQSSSILACTPENGNPPAITAPMFYSSSSPFPSVPASFWESLPGLPNGTNNGGITQSFSASPTLGKHSRDGSVLCEEKTEKSLWIPKTLRIDDLNEAAKSSILATLGIKPDEHIKGDGNFKAFQSATESKLEKPDAGQVHNANPAALSRLQTFQETTSSVC